MVRLRTRNTALFLSILLFFFMFGALLPAQTAHAANPVIYRGLFVGCGDYEGTYNDLAPSTINDANECCYIFSNAAYDGASRVKGKMAIATDIRESTLTSYLNPSRTSSVFYGADSNDVSVFYFSGHGTDYDENGRPAIVLTDGNTDDLMSVDALEAALHKIPGTKVVILDSCFSGAFIGKTYGAAEKSAATTAPTATPAPTATVTPTATAVPTATATPTATPIPTATAAPTATAGEPSPAGSATPENTAEMSTPAPTEAASPTPAPTESAAPAPAETGSPAPTPAPTEPTAAEQEEFAQALMKPFVEADQKMQARELLSQPEYIVFTASSGEDYSYGEAEGADAMGCFTRAYSDGLGRLGQHAADGNTNKTITVDEAYDSALELFYTYYGDELGESTAQIYPVNSSFTLMKYAKNGAAATGRANKNTYIYSSALPEKKVMRSLSSGTSVNVYGVLGNFYKVSVGEDFGYVYKSNISITSGSVGTPVLGTGKAKTATYVYSSTSTSSTRLLALGKGNMMDILGVSGQYYIVSAGGVTGCVPACAVTVVSGSVGPQPTSQYVLAVGKATAQTYVYKTASTTSTKVRTLSTGTRMTITKVTPTFYKVWVSGNVGYVLKKNVSIVSGTLNGTKPKSVNTAINAQGEAKELCYVYSTASTTATKLRTLYKGGLINILSVNGSFYKVLTNGRIGYALTKYLKVLSPRTLSAAGEAKALCYVYASRSTTSEKLLTLSTGGCMSILGVCGSFYKVTVSGVNGYIPTKYIKVL